MEKLKEVPEDEDQKASKKNKNLAFNCDKCDMVFSKADHLNKDHRNTEGYKNSEQNVCDKCEYTACTKRGITHHVKKIHATKVQIACQEANCCHLCGKSFTEKTNLYRHKKTMHEKMQLCKCPICHKVYTRNDDLKKHFKKSHKG